MNISIVGKQFELTEAIKEYVLNSFENFKKFNLDIISGRCVISADERCGRKGFLVDFSVVLAKKETIVVNQKDKDLYVAIDLASEKISKILAKHHEKIVNKDKNSNKIEVDNEKSNDVDEIILSELEIYKPIEVEEALEILKNDSEKQFFVFNDINAKLRVIYKKKNGKFGLY